MKALYRVKNSDDKTVGFMLDNKKYVAYYNALRNISLIENLTSNRNGVIKSKKGILPILHIKDLHINEYKDLCRKNPLKRDVQNELEEWKQNWSEYVLYLTGARQIGKTTELKKFAYKNYEQVIYVNLSEEDKLQYFEETVLTNSIYFGMINYCRKAGLEEFSNKPSTLLIIDEIQISHRIYNKIRALQSEINCHVAVTGSYLGRILDSEYFKPAGNMYEIEMLPLSFREFCRAFNLEDLLMNIDIYGKSSEEDYKKLTETYKIYREIGGYPAVVTHYIKNKNIEDCFRVIGTIIDRFTEESSPYFENDKCRIIFENVYKAAFRLIASEKKGTSSKDIQDITEFVKVDTKEHVSRKEINEAISWLKYSKILGSCDLYNQGNVNELMLERRFFFMDCGIANYIARTTPIDNDTVRGTIAENFAYTELYRVYKNKKGMIKGDKPCCSVYNNYELDFMIVDKDDKKYGIEVKSKQSTSHDSLDLYLKKKIIDVAYLAEITRGGISNATKIRKIPIYTVGCRFPYN